MPSGMHQHQSTYYLSQTQMDQCLTPEVKHQHLSTNTSTIPPDVMPEISKTPDPTPKFLTANKLEALLQMQKTGPFCKGYLNACPMVSTSAQNGSLYTCQRLTL